MTHLNDLKAGMKVRCVNNWCSDLTVGKEYEVLHVDEYTVHIIDDRGIECNYDIRLFEPTTKVNDGLDSMPCETVTESVVKTAPSNWISVDERLPEDGQEVLIFVGDGFFGAYMTVSYYRWNGRIKSWNNVYLNETVTYWQPLPSLPKEVQE